MIWDIIGISAAILTSSCFIPQIMHGIRTKRLNDVSYGMLIVLLTGMFLWIIYGIYLSNWVIISANIFAFATNLTLILLKRYYSKI